MYDKAVFIGQLSQYLVNTWHNLVKDLVNASNALDVLENY